MTKLVGISAAVFAQNPDQWQKLVDDRTKVPAAVEELLRFDGPVHYIVRCTLRDVTLHGVTIPAGAPVSCSEPRPTAIRELSPTLM